MVMGMNRLRMNRINNGNKKILEKCVKRRERGLFLANDSLRRRMSMNKKACWHMRQNIAEIEDRIEITQINRCPIHCVYLKSSVSHDKIIQNVQTKDFLCFTKFAKCPKRGGTLIIRDTDRNCFSPYSMVDHHPREYLWNHVD